MDWFIRVVGRIPLAKKMVGLWFERHLHQRASVDLVAAELVYNAEQMDPDHSPVSKYDYVRFDAWHTYQRDIHLRLRNEPELWEGVVAAYDALARMQRGAHGPSGDSLRDLATKVRATLG